MSRGVQLQTPRERRPRTEAETNAGVGLLRGLSELALSLLRHAPGRPRRASGRSINFEVELVHDPESDGWGFRVPSLGIVGGDKTRAAAVLQARDAIAFTLEGEEGSAPPAGVERIHIPARLGAPPHHVSA
ncbi:MAG TPA: hypothetical protein VMV23_01570 [Candidatus Nanopelagicaceae bacterium]|nr:hypothetical protein [Candidatus Nanopelagicaceae bacterium]